MKTVIVLGIARSGTSIVAGMLSLMGVNMHHDDNPGPDNPGGGFEDSNFIHLTKLLVKIKNDERIKELENQIKEIVTARNKEHEKDGIWGFKSALTYKCLDHFQKIINNPYYIIVYRDIEDTAKSLRGHWKYKNMQDVSLEKAIDHVVKSNEEFNIAINGLINANVIKFKFDNLRSHPIQCAREIAYFLDININKKMETDIENFVLKNYCSLDHYKFPRRQKKMSKKKSTKHKYSKEYFDEEFFRGKTGEKGGNRMDEQTGILFGVATSIHKLFGHNNYKFLEIGGGIGHLSRHLENLGEDIELMDVSPYAVEYNRASRASVGDVRYLKKLPAAGWDITICWNVLGYLEPRDIKRAIASLLHVTGYRCLVSITTQEIVDKNPYGNKGRRTIRPSDWWKDKFIENGFEIDDTLLTELFRIGGWKEKAGCFVLKPAQD